MEISVLITIFVSLFVIIDPIGLAPVFVALTTGMDARQRRAIALRACLISAGLLMLFGIFGDAILEFIGISLDAFRIAGGLLLFLTALDMLFERRSQRRAGQTSRANDPSVFPLSTPLIAGPGSLTAMILVSGQAGDVQELIIILLVMAAVVALVFLLFLAGGYLERLLGDTGIKVVTRLLGMLLAALSVQFVLDGLAGFVQSLAGG